MTIFPQKYPSTTINTPLPNQLPSPMAAPNPPANQPRGFNYVSPFENMNALTKIAIGMGGSSAVSQIEQAAYQRQLDAFEMQQEEARKTALQDIARRMQTGEIDRQGALMEYAERTGDFSRMFQQDTTPAAIKEFEYVSQLDPEEKALYFQNKRANQTFDRGGSQVILNPQGQIVGEIGKTLAPGEMPETRRQQAIAQAQGKIEGEAAATTDNKVADAELMLQTIDSVLEDKEGLEAATGGAFGLAGRQSALFPLGEDQRRIQPKIDQLKGQTFMQAYNNLKGGGVITEIEGTKAEAAIARLNQAQDQKDFEKALSELRGVVTGAIGRLKRGGDNAVNASQLSGYDQILPPPRLDGQPSTPVSGGNNVIDFGSLK